MNRVMKRESVERMLQLLAFMRTKLDELRQIADEEALQVGDRNLIDRQISAIGDEVEVLLRTLSDMLDDPTKFEK